MAMLPDTVKLRLEEECNAAKADAARYASQVRELQAKIALARRNRDAALNIVRGLNRALGLREDGTPRTPRGKQVGVTLEPAPPAIADHPLIVDAADLPTGMISLGPDGLQITPDASPDREE